MKPETQFIALLTWLGWTPRHHPAFDPLAMWGSPPGNKDEWKECPKLTLDLMHEAEKQLRGTPEQYHNDPVIHNRWAEYEHWLRRNFGTVHLEKEQRLEALVRTIGKWVEE